ncbi:MAG: FecR domain-containing protein [Proteobacteria bacterium]|nr:FecR domain-containing protein [Pseudomonadota bacterium]
MKEHFPNYSDQEAHRVARLIAGFIRGTLTRNEKIELDEWVAASDENMQLFERLTDEKNVAAATKWMEGIETEKALEKKKQSVVFNKAANSSVWLRLLPYAVAASVIIVLGLLFFNPFTNKNAPPVIVTKSPGDIPPGSDRATLTLDDGREIVLDSKANDTSINEKIKILQRQGEIVYSNQPMTNKIGYHTLTIPRKGQYKLVLPDGTKVWLNAESSIRYPVSFSDTERKVFVTGETYFEVAKDKSKPFRVAVNDIVVEALGTKFNINAYANEPFVSATLVEGSVLVTKGKAENILKPGQQAKLSAKDFSIANVESEDVTAWKDNQFKFSNTPLEIIMRQVERWYDAEIVYENTPSDHFNAEVSRDVPVSKLLHILELTKRVHFKIDNNKITVMK